jgi:hypothetical protein
MGRSPSSRVDEERDAAVGCSRSGAQRKGTVRYYYLEPEVAGGYGEDAILDTSVRPERVERLHYTWGDEGPTCQRIVS